LYWKRPGQYAEEWRSLRHCAHLDTETAVNLGPALVIFPDNTELDDTLGNLDNLEGLLVFGVGSQERLQAHGELVQGLLELGFAGKVGHLDG
jgi:hypothetical protein